MRGVAITAAGGSVALSVACGQVAPAPAAAPAKEAPKAEAPKAAEVPKAPAQQVVNYLHVDIGQNQIWQDSWKSIFAKFQKKYPNIKLEVVGTEFGQITTKAGAAQAGGIIFDSIYGHFSFIGALVGGNIIQPLDPFLAKDTEVKVDDFNPGTVERYKGKIYGLAWHSNAKEIWFNKNLFAQAGLKNPAELEAEGRWTWDAALEVAKKLTKAEGDKIAIGGIQNYPDYTSYLCMYAWAWGADFWNKDCSQPTFTSNEMRDAVQFQADLYTKHRVVGGNIFEGTQAMSNTGAFNTRTFNEKVISRKLFDIGVAPMPKGPKGRTVALANAALYLGAAAKNPEGGWTWLKHTVSPDILEEVAALGGARYVANKKIKPLAIEPYEDINVYIMQAKDARITPVILKQSDFDKAWRETWTDVINGKVTVPEALQKTQGQLENWLKEGGCLFW